MTQTVEFDLGKILERIEKNQIELKVGLTQLEGEVKATRLEIKNLQSGQDAINTKLNVQSTWFLSLLTGLVIGLLGLVAAVGRVVFFPNP
jgi:hypothetical protein